MKPWFLRRIFAGMNITRELGKEWRWKEFFDNDSGYCLDRFTIDWQWEEKHVS